MSLVLIPEYSGINKGQRFPDRFKAAHRKLPIKCILTIAALFTIAKTWKQSRYPSIDKVVVHIYNGILLSHKKEYI